MKRFLLLLMVFFAFSLLLAEERHALLWFDATANFARLSSADSVRMYLDKTKAAGFTDIVVDVKPITGEVLYSSAIAPEMKEWRGFRRDSVYQFLSVMIQEAHCRGLRIHASLNIFSGGHNFFDRGICYTKHPEWASTLYTDTGMVGMMSVKAKYSTMLNPANPEIQRYELSILKELASRYPQLDGVILDRVRYDGIAADFSDLSRKLFEKHIDAALQRFPGDIFEWKKGPTGISFSSEGPYYHAWLEWRAGVVHDFIAAARKTIKAVAPKMSFGDYTGAWYPIYYEVGVNWASSTYDPAQHYAWATATYKNTGYAELLDLFTSGNYFYEVTKEEGLANKKPAQTETGRVGQREYWYSVEGSCEIAAEVTRNVVPVYGGLYVEQYAGHPEQFARAVHMCLKKSDGLMVFDLVHIVNYNWWGVLTEAIKEMP